MQVHDLLHAAQANPRAKHGPGDIRTASEALEHVRQIVRLDADALVLDRDDLVDEACSAAI